MTVPALAQRRAFGKPAVIGRHRPPICGHLQFSPIYWHFFGGKSFYIKIFSAVFGHLAGSQTKRIITGNRGAAAPRPRATLRFSRPPPGVRGTGFMEFHPAGGRFYPALILTARITLPHFSVSSAMNFPH